MSISLTQPGIGSTNWGEALNTNWQTIQSAINNLSGRNRIINGSFKIDQRNNGTAVTINSSTVPAFGPDRWSGVGQSTNNPGEFTISRATSTPPPGQSNYLRAAITVADASIHTDASYYLRYAVEGFDWASMAFGTADAKTVTLSFKFRTSISGTNTWGGMVCNYNGTRHYLFSFQSLAANSWHDIEISIPGDTSGGWQIDFSVGIFLTFCLGAGANVSGSAGSWSNAALDYGVTGQTQLISTSNATYDIAAVQLEEGANSTQFEFRSIQQELALCLRYAYVYESTGTNYLQGAGYTTSTTQGYFNISFPVPMRTRPTFINSINAGSDWYGYDLSVLSTITTLFQIDTASSTSVNPIHALISCQKTGAGWTANRPFFILATGTGKRLGFDAEL